MSGYPPSQQYPPVDEGYPQRQPEYPPSQPAHPPPQAALQAAYPPPQDGYPPSQAAYPAPQAGYPLHDYPSPAPAAQPEQCSEISVWDKRVRLRFIRKMYFVLMLQLAFTCGIVVFVRIYWPADLYIRFHRLIYIIPIVVFLIVYLVLVVEGDKRIPRSKYNKCCCLKKRPVGVISLAIFTIALTFMLATISSYHGIDQVAIGLGIKVGVALAVTLYACQTKYDFTMGGGILFVSLMAILFSGLAGGICHLINPQSGRVLQVVYGGVGALLFSMYVAFDTQLLFGWRKHLLGPFQEVSSKQELSPNEEIYAALHVYLDIALLLFTLCTFGRCRWWSITSYGNM